NLTRALLATLSAAGRITAVDTSTRMIEVARAKIQDQRVEWHTADAQRLPLGDACCDRVICYSVWPHFDDRAAVARELGRVLRDAGYLHVWHSLPREQVNRIHRSAGEPVCNDLLPPAAETAETLAAVGFRVTAAADTADGYLVTAVKSPSQDRPARWLAPPADARARRSSSLDR
ncbi:MAG: class I SAM-dependent methyltransferase, partial [Pseudomonadota bacterium]